MGTERSFSDVCFAGGANGDLTAVLQNYGAGQRTRCRVRFAVEAACKSEEYILWAGRAAWPRCRIVVV